MSSSGRAIRSAAETSTSVGTCAAGPVAAASPVTSRPPAASSRSIPAQRRWQPPSPRSTCEPTALNRLATSCTKASPAESPTKNTSPGFVQNCPAELVTLVVRSAAISAARSARAPGRSTTGLMLPISTQITLPAALAAVNSARPAASLPVKPVAPIRGSATSRSPSRFSTPCSSWTVAAGRPISATAAIASSAASFETVGWPGWALAITGLPAAIAATKSPPVRQP